MAAKQKIRMIGAIVIMVNLALAIAIVMSKSRPIAPEEVYRFPEQTAEIAITRYSAGQETAFSFRDADDLVAIMEWYYGLRLAEMSQPPEMVEGNEGYAFLVNGATAFDYDDRNGEAFLYINDADYEVMNPSKPPL